MTRKTSKMPITVPTAHCPKLGNTVFSHRGLNTVAPENTMAAFRKTAEAGLTWIETDVDILADGTPIILHDTTLDRTTDRAGSFYGLRASDLDSIDAGSWFGKEFTGERIPTLAELVQFMNENKINANVELKANEEGAARSQELIERVVAELEKLDPEREIVISSFSQPLLMRFHDYAPQYAIGVLYETAALYEDWLSVLELCGATYIHVEDEGLTRQKVEAFTAAGYGVNVWTVNSKGRANELFNWGCTGVFSDIADQLPTTAKGALND